MELTITTPMERIGIRYTEELKKFNVLFGDKIDTGDLQTNWKEHKWLSVWLNGADDLPDELWNFLHHHYLMAGWYLEKDWGEEGTEYEGKLMAIKLFVANREAVDEAIAKNKELLGEQ